MLNAQYLPYDRIITNDGIVFELQSRYSLKDSFVIGRPKFFPNTFYDQQLGIVYECGENWFKIPVTPQLYPLSNRLIRSINPTYTIPELEDISILEYYSIPIGNINGHFSPRETILSPPKEYCKTNRDAREIMELLKSEGLIDVIGIGGSIMMGLSGDYSDIDLIVYSRENFLPITKVLFAHKKTTLRPTEELRKRYEQFNEQFRAGINLEEYIFNESNKRNRGYFNGTKLTINVVDITNHPKIPTESLETKSDLVGIVKNDRHAYTHPAILDINLCDDSGVQINKEMKVISLSRVFIGQVKLNDVCLMRGYFNPKQNYLIVHHSFGWIKPINIK